MRSTKASAAIERLRVRSGNTHYSMSTRANGLFALLLTSPTGEVETVGSPLPLDEFVRFVNGIKEAAAKPDSKLDVAFREQLKRKD